MRTSQVFSVGGPLLRLFKKKPDEPKKMSLLDHMESLRWHVMRSVIAVIALAVVAFCYSNFIFGNLLFGPKQPGFFTYKALCSFSSWAGAGSNMCITPVSFDLVNINMSGQFTMHMWVSFVAGAIMAAPVILFELWRFVAPALRKEEKRHAALFIASGTMLFLTGVLFSYYILVPMSINFLAGYQVSSEVANMPTLDSYISTVTTLTLLAGIVFELPIIVYFLTRFGVITPQFMRKARKHAVVIILIVAAIITPSADVFTQMAVAIPVYGLYEISIYVSAFALKRIRARAMT